MKLRALNLYEGREMLLKCGICQEESNIKVGFLTTMESTDPSIRATFFVCDKCREKVESFSREEGIEIIKRINEEEQENEAQEYPSA